MPKSFSGPALSAVLAEGARTNERSQLGQHYLEDALRTFRDYKNSRNERSRRSAMKTSFALIDKESNSIAVNMKHMAGNMISRWTDFLTTDGEKPERDRDIEFVMLPGTTKDEMVAYWEKGWKSRLRCHRTLTA